jgi:hypothetical protein
MCGSRNGRKSPGDGNEVPSATHRSDVRLLVRRLAGALVGRLGKPPVVSSGDAGEGPEERSSEGNAAGHNGAAAIDWAVIWEDDRCALRRRSGTTQGFYLNGASVQEAIGQQAGIIPNLDSIEEFRILTSNADAEYGGFSGGVINVITKSGGNEIHRNTSRKKRRHEGC